MLLITKIYKKFLNLNYLGSIRKLIKHLLKFLSDIDHKTHINNVRPSVKNNQ